MQCSNVQFSFYLKVVLHGHRQSNFQAQLFSSLMLCVSLKRGEYFMSRYNILACFLFLSIESALWALGQV